MTRQILYIAAPLRPTSEQIAAGLPRESWLVGLDEWRIRYPGDVKRHEESCLRANIDRGMRWLSWLRRSFPETTFIAPWICIVLSGDDDTDPAVRERAMQDNLAVIERCDGIVLCGGRISEGMRRELEHGARSARGPGREVFAVYNLIRVGGDPLPFIGEIPHPFASWAGLFRE